MTVPGPPIRILHLLSDDALGGGGRYLADLARFSGPEFTHVVAVPSMGVLSSFLEDAGLVVEVVDTRNRISLRGLREIARCAARHRSDIVHTHGFRSTFYGRLAFLLSHRKVITTVHVSLFDYVDTPAPIRMAYIIADRLLAFRSNRFICISQAMRCDTLRLGAAPERITLVPNGVDTSRFHPRPGSPVLRRSLGIVGRGPVIGTVGRAVNEKGQAYLVESLPPLVAQWPELRCLFVGDGPELDRLRRRAADLAVGAYCVFAGVRQDIQEIYPLLDVFVLPSVREPFGLALLEAMACGVPVVATAAGGPLDFIRHGLNGVLVSPRDAAALGRAIASLLTDPDFAHRLGESGRATAEQEYPIEAAVRKTAGVYSEVLGMTRTVEEFSTGTPSRNARP